MYVRSSLAALGGFVLGLALAGQTSAMIVVASDNGGDTAYDGAVTDAWNSGDDGGFGFAPWSISTGGNGGDLVESSTGLSSPGADIDTSGRSLGLFATSGGFANAFRSFDAPLAVGSTFSLDIAVNFRNGAKGVNLLTAGGTELLNFNVGNPGSGDDYRVNNAASGNGSIGDAYSADTAFNLAFTQDTLAGGTWTITRSGGVADVDTGTYSGQAGRFQLYIAGTDGGSPNNLYANNFQIAAIPEISAALAVGPLVVGLVLPRRRVRAT